MTTWEFGGTELDTFGRVTLINDYLDLPDKRGENVLIPFRHGQFHVNKFFEQRIMSFGIAVIGTSASDLEDTFDEMRALFSPSSRQILEQTLEDSSKRQALAEVRSKMTVERFSDKIAKVVVQFTLAQPFFRSDTILADNETVIDASPHAMVVDNIGTVAERDATIILTGPLSNTVITNTENGNTLTYNGTIASPRVVTISTSSTGQYVATTDLGANVIGNISHSGDSALMVFEVGENTLSITDATATTGTVKVSFYPPFI